MFTTKEINNHIIVSFVNQKRLNIVIARKVQKFLTKFVSTPNQNLVLNLEKISFIDSEGFEMLSLILQIAESNNSTFGICNISNEAQELFELKNMTSTFKVLDYCAFGEKELV